MRWIEIDLTGFLDDDSRRLLSAVRDRQRELPRLQRDAGLGSAQVVRFLAEQGERLFGVVRGRTDAALDLAGDEPLGLHVVTEDLDLPWTCLHDGLRFLLERMAITASASARSEQTAPWVRRRRDSDFAAAALGPDAPADVARRFRPDGCAEPEILYVAAADAAQARSREEQAALEKALDQVHDGVRLGRLKTPASTPSPSLLLKRAVSVQGFHYAASTVHPAPDEAGVPAADLGAWQDVAEVGDELEVVGVDPVDALLDTLSERAETAPLPLPAAVAVAAAPAWRFDDGHLRPEDLQGLQAVPALVVSNSYLSLSALGSRFLAAGASTFVGTQALVTAGDARDFAADFYTALGRGRGAAAALREASLAARERRGADHPLWLSYGLLGAGDLALQYL
ncbi:MAG TPA: CHAT domain-containing protein [Candidatus Krumholzibacteria bacterium]|nr:CHAT domain-containing protein [Candidatus Krumholzibacteria bacterium]HRX51152.1 CHAT domain-containing protein [Candidatus Krumholzibacteria bacterium]